MKTGSKRIEWIDMCRGLIMILVVIGHSIPVSTPLRFIIFTFHMPALFVISGIVFKPIEIGKSIGKYAKRLLVPLYAGGILLLIYRMFHVWSVSGGKEDYLYWLKRTIKAVLFASGVSSPKGFEEMPAFGMLWFLAAMFWAMILFNLVIRLTEKKNLRVSMYVCVAVAAIGYWITTRTWLPMNFDISMMAVVYLFMGYAIKKRDLLGNKKEAFGLLWISIALWVMNYALQGKIEMAQRNYKLFVLSFLASMAGSYILIFLCARLYQNNVVTRFLSFIGSHSLEFLVFHFIDSNMAPWEKFIQGTIEDTTYACVWIQYRIVFILAGVVLWCGLKALFKSIVSGKWKKVSQQEAHEE